LLNVTKKSPRRPFKIEKTECPKNDFIRLREIRRKTGEENSYFLSLGRKEKDPSWRVQRGGGKRKREISEEKRIVFFTPAQNRKNVEEKCRESQ